MPFIKILADLSPDIKSTMEADLELYEKKQGVTVNYRQFSLVLTLDNKDPVGVLTAYTAFAEIYIDDIWINSPYRQKGYGKMLMQYLENHFKDKGFNNINLVTNEFQAPKFYQKCGYELEFVRKNLITPQLTKYFYIKYFDNKTQTQGCGG